MPTNVREFAARQRQKPEIIPGSGVKLWYHNSRWFKVHPLPIDGLPIWERIPRETPKAWIAFQVYRDLGPTRSLTKVSRALQHPDDETVLTKPKTSIRIWQNVNHWVQRADAWDRHVDSEARRAQVDARLEMVDRHTNIARTFQEKVQSRLNSLDPDKLTPMDLAKWLDVAVKVERMAAGDVAEKVDIESKILEMARSLNMDPDAAKAEALRILKGTGTDG